MEKPFVVCHMFVSMDGKIDGAFMGCEAAEPSRAEYARLRGEYACDAVVYGTVTMAQGFSDGLAGELPASTVQVSREDWAAPVTWTASWWRWIRRAFWVGIPAIWSGQIVPGPTLLRH